jgi:hypothetical protein
MRPCTYGHAYITARVYKIRVLSKHKPTLKSQIPKERVIKSMIGHSLSTCKLTHKTKIDIHRDATSRED